ncbi:uncharacterized protein LOC116913169 [Rattus rattus]|uniref:uncharacterized protein LOC116913169 n=1 Tax=Rattus rattus TaxID=10117 RepID=UPI0013F2F2E0|nr:uncharacterized protein LOC116913169 [Rattus rattus]
MILHPAGHTVKGIPRPKFSKEAEKTVVGTGIIIPQAQALNEEDLVEFVPRNLSTKLESWVRHRVPRVAGLGRGGRRGAARSPLPSLCPPPLPWFLFPLPQSPPPRTAELELSLPSPATLGGGAKCRLFLALSEQSRLPGAERTRRGVTLTFFWKTALQESRRTKFQTPEHSSNQGLHRTESIWKKKYLVSMEKVARRKTN